LPKKILALVAIGSHAYDFVAVDDMPGDVFDYVSFVGRHYLPAFSAIARNWSTTPPSPARASAPPNPRARPEAAAGLDGWLADRLFGGSR